MDVLEIVAADVQALVPVLVLVSVILDVVVVVKENAVIVVHNLALEPV